MIKHSTNKTAQLHVRPAARSQRGVLAVAGLWLALAVAPMLIGCGSDGGGSDGNGSEPDPPVTLTPVSMDTTADFVVPGTRTALDLGALAEATGLDTPVGLEGSSHHSNSPTIILKQWFSDAQDQTTLRYSEYDFDSGRFTSLADAPPTHAISRDGSAITWLESGGCTLWYQRLQPTAEPVRINDSLREFACPRVPALSADGSTVWFDQAVGRYDDTGVLRYEGFDKAEYSVAIVRPTMQSVIELASRFEPLGESELEPLSSVIGYPSGSSRDGQRLVFRGYFLPESPDENGDYDYVIGTLLVDTGTGATTLLNQNRYNRFYSSKVPASVQDDATISGDGRVVWYLESDGVTTNETIAPSLLQRRDLETGQVTTIALPGLKDSLYTSADGNTLVFQLDDEVVVYRYDSNVLLRTSTALQFCTDPANALTCEFDESSYYVLDDPASISDDGSTVLIKILSQRPGIDTPQNTQELMMLDVHTGTLQRLAPNLDVLFTAMTPSADRIVFLTEWSDTGEYLGEDRVVVVDR